MKTWFDWMEEYYLPQPQQEAPHPGETERILALVRRKTGLEEAPPLTRQIPVRRAVRPRRLWGLVAAAVLAVCLGTGAMASGAFPWFSVGAFFGADGRQQAECLGMPGEGMSLSQTKDGVTITLEGILDDGSVAYIPAQITFEEGRYDPALNYHPFATLKPTNPLQNGSGSVGSRALEDPDPTDTTVPLMLAADHEGLQAGDTVRLEILALYGNTEAADGSTSTAWEWEGNMTFSFMLPESRPAITVQAPADAIEPQTGVPIAQVRLTPLQVEVIFAEHPADSQVRDILSRVPISLTMQDGTTCTLPEGWEGAGHRTAEGSGTGLPDFDGPCYAVRCEFGTILDPASVASVIVSGIEIPIL